jgi:hypothetical protein
MMLLGPLVPEKKILNITVVILHSSELVFTNKNEILVF